MNTKLFKTEQVRKFFNLLNKLDRSISKIYGNNSCAREVFVRRTLNKYLKQKLIILLCESETTKIYYNKYIMITNVEYALHYSTEIIVTIFDYSRPYDLWNSIVIDHNKALALEGSWSKNGKIHNSILKLTIPQLPEKEFIFETWDFDKYPKRKKKGQTEDDILNSIKSTISFKATTYKEVYEIKKKFEKENKFKLVIGSDIIEIKNNKHAKIQ